MNRRRTAFIVLLFILGCPLLLFGQDLATGLEITSDSLLSVSRPAGPPAALVESGRDLQRPRGVDLSPMFPVPGDQGMIGSCGPWSVAYAAKTYLEHIEHGWDQNDPANQFSPSFLYNLVNGGRDVGSSFTDLFSVLLTRGVATLETMPYTTDLNRQPSRDAFREATEFRARSYYRLEVDQHEAIRVNLAAGNPVLFGMNVNRQFMNYQGGVFRDERAANLGGHAMCLVGYDDDRNAYKLINSWGTRWGEEGFAWIDYDTFERLTNEVWILEDRVATVDKVLPPRDVRAGEGESTQFVAVSWLEPDDEGTRFRVYRADLAEEQFALLGESDEGVFLDEGALPGVEYLYAVSAIVGREESDLSAVAIGYRAELDEKPGVPRDLATLYVNDNVELTWTAVEGAEYYEILRYAPDGFFYVVGASSDSFFVDRNLPQTASAQYTVRAINRFGPGDLAWVSTVQLTESGGSSDPAHVDIIADDESSADDRQFDPSNRQRVSPTDRARDLFDPEAIHAYFEQARRDQEEAFRRYREEQDRALEEWRRSEDEAFREFLESQRR